MPDESRCTRAGYLWNRFVVIAGFLRHHAARAGRLSGARADVLTTLHGRGELGPGSGATPGSGGVGGVSSVGPRAAGGRRLGHELPRVRSSCAAGLHRTSTTRSTAALAPPCQSGALCTAGACKCQGGLTEQRDLRRYHEQRANCGTCSHLRRRARVCSLGVYSATCASGLTQCGQSCIDPMSDVANCGTCGNVCGTGLACSLGICCGCGGVARSTAAPAALTFLSSNCGVCVAGLRERRAVRERIVCPMPFGYHLHAAARARRAARKAEERRESGVEARAERAASRTKRLRSTTATGTATCGALSAAWEPSCKAASFPDHRLPALRQQLHQAGNATTSPWWVWNINSSQGVKARISSR